MSKLFISPAEPKVFHALGIVSRVPEDHGVDFMWEAQGELIGVQRKEVKDLVASLRDGRIAKELGQMRALDLAGFLIEGDWRWGTNGMSMTVSGFSRTQYRGILWSMLSAGLWVADSRSKEESIECIYEWKRWTEKPRHGSLSVRPKEVSQWGKGTSRDWGVHLLQSFPGIGVGVAESIYDHFGRVPLQWTVDEAEMAAVKGLGKKRILSLMSTFAEPNPNSNT